MSDNDPISEGCLNPEVWIEIEGWPYQVSSIGRIRRISGGRGATPMRILRPGLGKNGYLTVVLHGQTIKRTFYVHVLVCRAFHGVKPTNKHEVAHKDGVRTNCRKENVRWATRKENMIDAKHHGTTTFGIKNKHSKLVDSDIIEIRKRFNGGVKQADLAIDFGVHQSTISLAISGKRWSHVA